MEQKEGPFIKQEKQITPLSREVVVGVINDPVELGVEVGQGDKKIKLPTITGFSDGQGIHKKPLHYLFVSQETLDNGFRVDTNEEEVLLSEPGYMQVSSGEKFFLGGEEFKIREDPWQNLRVEKAESILEIDFQHKKTMGEIVELWEAAIRGEQDLDDFLKKNIDGKTVREINETVICLEKYPELQNPIMHASQIDVWELARYGSEGERQKALKKLYVSSSFFETEAFAKLMEITDKVSSKRDFSEDDIAFLNAMACSERATSESIHSLKALKITPWNRKYVVANLAENYLARELVPQETFRLHRQYYERFAEVMKSCGEKVPPWFDSYRGDEFVFGSAVDSIIANVGGKYFFSLPKETAESIAGILNHERVHFLIGYAKTLLKDYPMYEGFRSEEAFVESLSLLIKYEGNAQAALESQDLSRTCYKQAAKELLIIIKGVNELSGEQMLGTRLMFRGIMALADGETTGLLEPLESYYNQSELSRKIKFAERMAAFSDKRRIYSMFETGRSQNLSQEEIERVIGSVTYKEAKATGFWLDKKYFLSKRKWLVDNPLDLLGWIDREVKEIVCDKVVKNKKANKELQAIVDDYYSDYLAAIKDWIRTGTNNGNFVVKVSAN